MKALLACLLLLVIGRVRADGNVCAQSCRVSGNEAVVYEPGKQYRYQYHGDVVTRSRATQSEVSRMTVRSYVIITARNQCDLKLQVVNLAVDDVPAQDSQWFKNAVEQHDLHFSYKNGMVSHLCPHEEEEVVATNFKRGILSAIQAKMTKADRPKTIVYEADVLGECETEYRVTESRETIVNKTKHNCRFNNYLPYIPHERYSRRDLTGEAPLHSSDQRCQMHLRDRVWSRVECVEEMELKEFGDFFRENNILRDSSSDSGSNRLPSLASVSVSTTLVLEAGPEDNHDSFTEDGPRKRRESLRMDLEGAIKSADSHQFEDSNIPEQITVTMDYLMASAGHDSGISEQRPHAFAHLVTLINRLDAGVELDEIWGTYVVSQTSRQFILDAVLLCESRVCTRFLTLLAADAPEAFPQSRVLGWLAGIHFYSEAHPESVEYLMELARNKVAVEHQAVMAASSVVHRLCQRDQFNCQTNAQPLMDYVNEKVGDSCGYGESHEGRLQVMKTLRALSNAGVLPQEHFLRKCYMNKLMKPEIRVAALQSYRRVTCSKVDFDDAWQVLRDVEEDVSVRIAAYLSMVRCSPSRPKFFTGIKQLLLKEEVNQVASYIWTHVNNLAEKPGGNTHSRELSRLASHHTLQAKFNTNAFRTSRNYRVAQFSKLMNIGGSIDSDLIYTPESFIPRYVSNMFHLDFLENSIDAFEFGADFKGVENYIDRFFGKDGYFENQEIQKIIETLRPKRDIHDERIQEMQMLYDESRMKTELEESEEGAKTGFYFRVFGNEIFYVDNIFETNPWMFIQQLVREFSSPRSFQILKQEFVSPTILGFPMRFRVNATGSVTYDQTGDFRMNSMTDFHLEGQVLASTSISMDESLMVEGYGSSSGVRRRSTHVVNAEFGGKLAVQNGELIDMRFDVPSKELARMSSSVKVQLYDNYRQGWNENKDEGLSEGSESCSQDAMMRITGLEFCSSSEQAIIETDSGEKLQGDVYTAEHTLSKSDSFDFYQIMLKKQRRNYEFMFDTPGSSIDRKVELQVIVRPGDARGSLTMPGKTYNLEGTYKNTEALREVALQYREDSTIQGEIEFSLPMTPQESIIVYTPRFLLRLNNVFELDVDGTFKTGTDILSVEGNMQCSLLNDPMSFKASWEHEAEHHKIEGNIMMGDISATTSGTLFLNGAKMLLQLDSEYGRDQPNTFTLTFDKTLLVEREGVRQTGYLLVESSVGKTNVELDYDYGATGARIDTNITVVGTEVTSHVLAKNVVSENERDLEVTLQLASPQLGVDYLGQAIYKVSDKAFRGEVEVTIGDNLNTKLALSYLFDKNPLHLQGGVHFHLNDFVLQFVHEIDFSQPDMFLITSSDIIGPAVGVLQVEVFYDHLAPFNATLDVHAGYGDGQFGIKAATSSDESWSRFEGPVDLWWFDWAYSVNHEVEWGENKKRLALTCEDGGLLETVLQTEPDFLFQFTVKQDPSGDPDVKYGIEKRIEGTSTTYETYLRSYTNDLFHLTATDLGGDSYSGKARFMESELELYGQFTQKGDGDVEAQAQATVKLPSGETYQPQVTFKHSYDGQVRELQFASYYEEKVIQGQVMMVHRDGWFTDDTRKFSLSFTSPFEGLKKIGMAFEAHSDWAEPWFVEAEWEEIKVRGEMQLGDNTNLEAKLKYEDGGTCDSVFHLYHKYDGQHYMSGATLGITKAHDPWSVEVIVTDGDTSVERSLDVSLTFQSPLQQTPFEAKGRYNLSNTHFSFEIEAGYDSKTRLSFSGENETVMGTRKLVSAINFDSPWADPVFFNIENLQDSGSFNVSLDLRTSWEHVQTVGAEFSVDYNMPRETRAHFYLTQQNLQVTMEMIHKLSDQSLTQQIQGSINSMLLNYDLNAKWDKHFMPENSDGHLSISGMFDHNLELSFSNKRKDNQFNTEVSGSWDWYHVYVDHVLEFDHPLKWSSTLQINLPEDKSFMTRLFLNSQRDFSSVESTFHFNSSWTEGFTANLEIHGDNIPNEYNVEATYGDITIFNALMHANDSFQLEKADLSLSVTSSLFNNCKLIWQHDFSSGHLAALEFSYGEDFHIIGKSHLRQSQGFFSKEFQGYDFAFHVEMTDPLLIFRLKFGFDEMFSGELQVRWYEYLLFTKSSIPENTVFAASLSYPGDKFHTELLYENGTGNIPDFSFRFTRNDVDLFTFNGEFTSEYPVFSGVFSLYYFDEITGIPKNGRFEIRADMTHIRKYQFKGMMKLNSDFEGFESYWADLDTGMQFDDGIQSHLHGQLHLGDWHYKTKSDYSLDFNTFMMMYKSAYELTFRDQLQDKKELSIKFMNDGDAFECEISTSPKLDSHTWTAYVSVNTEEMDFKGYIIPGNEKKYELALNVSKSEFTLDAQRVDEQGAVFNFLHGNISWTIRKLKKQFIINITSDIPAIKKVTGQLIVQQRKGIAANLKLRVNKDELTGFLRLIGRGGKNAGKIIIKVENNIIFPFTTNTNLEYSMKPNEVAADLKMELDGQKDWVKASVKGSLSESYVRFSLPFENFKDFDLSVSLETEEKYGLRVEITGSVFCFSLNGSLSKFYDVGSLDTKFDWKCSGDPLFDYNLRYNFENSNSTEAHTHLRAMNFGNLFKLDFSGNFEGRKFKTRTETEIYPYYHHITTISGEFLEPKGFTYKYHTEDVLSEETIFLYRFLLSENDHSLDTELDIEVLNTKVIEFKSHFDMQENSPNLDASYSHSVFGKSFNSKLTVESALTSESGSLEAHLSTDGSFDHADLTVNYEKQGEDFQGHFKLETSLGNAEGDTTVKMSETMSSIEAVMQSDLHSFKNYQVEVSYEHPENKKKLWIKSKQDDIEFEINCLKTNEEDMEVISMEAKMPFETLSSLEIILGYPQQKLSDYSYEVKVGFTLLNEHYELHANHRHHESWRNQETRLSVSTPSRVFGSYGASFSYDLNGQTSLDFKTSRGHFGLDGSWGFTDSNLVVELNVDLALFNQGEYRFKANIPIKLYQKVEVNFSRLQTNFDFDAHLLLDGNYRNGEISFKIQPSDDATIYSMSYRYKNRLDITGQWDTWNISVKAKFTGGKVPITSGTFDITTSIEGYETITGSWNYQYRKRVYSAEANIDVGQSGAISFGVSFSNQPKGIPTPWQSVILEVSFDSPFTKHHQLKAEYSIPDLKMSVSYQHGTETFEVNMSSTVTDRKGNIIMAGNVPFNGISTFDIRFEYDLQESLGAAIKLRAEETLLELNFEVDSRWTSGQSRVSWSSPFTSPLDIVFKWSFDNSPFTVEATWRYGNQKIGINMNLEYSDTSAQFYLNFMSPFKFTSHVQFDVMYDFADSSNMKLSTELKVDEYFLKIESGVKTTGEHFIIDIRGSVEIFKLVGSMIFEFKIVDDTYNIEFSGETENSEKLFIIANLTKDDMHFNFRYGNNDIMDIILDFNKAKINFTLGDVYFNMISHYKKTINGYEVDCSIQSSEMHFLSIKAIFNDQDHYEGSIEVIHGEKKYNVNGSLSLQKRASSITFRFESSEDVYNPIVLSAMYDLSNFFQGKMKSEAELISMSYEWGEKIQFSLKGQRRGKRTKLNLEIVTPFDMIPELRFGYQGDLLTRGSNIDLNFTSFFEWSEKVTITGMLKFKNNKLNSKLTLTTPYSAFENLSLTLKYNANHFETTLVLNGEEWKAVCDYQFSPVFSVSLTAHTPIDGFSELSLNTSAVLESNKFNAKANLTWENNHAVELDIVAELWNLEIHLKTPWEPLKDSSFVMSLRTESEELMYTLDLKWNSTVVDFVFVFSPIQSKLEGNYVVDNEEVGKIIFNYQFNSAGIEISAELKTPFEIFSLSKMAFSIDFREKSLKFSTTFSQDFHMMMEVMNYGRVMNLEGSLKNYHGETPYSIEMNYVIEPQNYAFTGKAMVASEITWVSLDVDFNNDWRAEGSVYNDMITIKLTKLDDQGFQFNLNAAPVKSDLESLNLLATLNPHDGREYDGLVSLVYKHRGHDIVSHELNWQGIIENTVVSMTFKLDSDLLEMPYNLKVSFPLMNVLKSDGKIELILGSDVEELYKFMYDMSYPQKRAFSHILMVQFPDWTAELSAVLTRSNFQFSFYFPNEETKHSVVVSWPRDISLEKLTLQLELSSPYLKEGDVNVVFNFNVQQRLHFTLTSSLTYGLKTVDVNSEFQYIKRQKKSVFETSVTSDWIGNYAVKANIGWLRDITADFMLSIMDEEHTAELQINREEYTAEFTLNSPWLSSEQVKVTGMVNKDFGSYNILVEAKLEADSNDYSIEGKFESTNEKFMDWYFIMKQKHKDVLRVSGLFELKDDLMKLDFRGGSDIFDLSSSSIYMSYQNSEDDRTFTATLMGEYYEYFNFNLYLFNSKDWRGLQQIRLGTSKLGSINCSFTLGEEDGEIELRLSSRHSRFYFEFEYDINEEFEFEIKLETPFNNMEMFTLEIELPFSNDSRKYIKFYYMWHDDELSFDFYLTPDKITGWSVGAYLITPFEGYERFSLQTPQTSSNKFYNVLIEYPGGKVGFRGYLEAKQNFFTWSLYLPFEDYEIVSLKFNTNNNIDIEARVGKVGCTFFIGTESTQVYHQLRTLIRINEYRTEGYFRIYNFWHRHWLHFHVDLEMKDFSDIKFFDFETRYDASERLLIAARTDQKELAKVHAEWGANKVIAITTPKVYPGYLVLNLESSETVNDYQVEVGIQGIDRAGWETYGFHVHQKQLGYGRDLLISGEAGDSQIAVAGTITLNPMYNNNFYIKEKFSVELNHQKLGFVTYFHADPGFYTNSYSADLQIILPDQTLRWNTNASCSGQKFDLLSHFKWNDLDVQEEPITITIDYDNLSAMNSEHILRAVFSHPQIQNLTLQGNLTQAVESELLATAEFLDENDPERNIVFKMSSASQSEEGICIIRANVTQPSSNFIIDLDAEITESVFNRAAYKLSYWSHSKQRWEVIDLTTGIESVDHGWHFTANVNKSDSNWGYNYNGSLLHRDESFSFSIMAVSRLFMDYWRLETSVNKLMPELDMQLQIGQSQLEPHEISRIRAGLHNPLELGIMLDHQRFGVWRQDVRAGLRLRNQDLLQLVVEYDPSFDLTSESLVYRLASPADKISHAWLRDLSYAATALQNWASMEVPQVVEAVFNPDTFRSIHSYSVIKYEHFKHAIVSTFSLFYGTLEASYTQTVKPFLDSSIAQTMDMFTALRPYFEDIRRSWIQMIEFLDIEYVRFHDQLIEYFDRFSYWLAETNHEMTIKFKNIMYEMVRAMNDISEEMAHALEVIQQTFGPTFESYQIALERYGRELEAVFGGQCWPRIQQEMNRITVSLSEVWSMAEEFVQPAEYLHQMRALSDWAMATLSYHRHNFEGGMSKLKDSISRSFLFGELMNEYRHVERFVSDVMRDGFYVTFQRKMAEVGPQLVATADRAVYALRVRYHELQQTSRGNVLFDYFDAVTGSVLERIVLTWEDWRTSEYQVLETFQRFFVSFVDTFKKVVQEGASFTEESIIFEPKVKGIIIYNQYLPVPWNSFLEGPQWFRLVNAFKKESSMVETKRKLHEGIDKLHSQAVSLLIPGSAYPPFTATATVYGQQITTFDLHHYQFLGSCTYLMTKDFVGGDFEVIGDYERSEDGEITLRSMTVRAQGADVTLHVDGAIDVRNIGSAEVLTDGSYVAFKQGSLFVTCNKLSQGCSVTVGSKYFGRVAGLFGNYNYEPSDDSTGPDGRTKARDGNDIANSWSVSSATCYQANQVKAVSDLSDVSDFGRCHDLFLSSSSPLSSCFRTVDSRPYFWHCVRDLQRPDHGNRHRLSPCDSADAYRTQCASRNIHVLPLHQCPRGAELIVEKHQEAAIGMKEVKEKVSVSQTRRVEALAPMAPAPATCEVEGNTVPEGWSNTYKGATQGSTDIAFVVELANCNKGRNLQLLLRLVKVQLKRAGIQDVRYALVTDKAEDFNVPSEMESEDELNTQLGDLVLDGPKSDNGGAEVIKATARQLKWRPGVSRNIIHLPCRPCDDSQAVAEALSENDVTYHIITKFKVAMNGPNAKKSKAMAAKVYGFDTKRIYTPKDGKKFTGNVNLRKLFQAPESSSCFEAAQSSGGSIFNINKWTSKSAVVEKKYLGIYGQRILKSSTTPECQECRCLRQGDGAGISCRKCGSDWPAVEVRQVQVVQAVPQESSAYEGGEEGGRDVGEMDGDSEREDVAQDIKQTFKKEFIEDNAAFAQVEQKREGGGSEDEQAPEGEQEEVEEEVEEEEEEESEESEEDYGDYLYQDYLYQDYSS